MSFEESSDRRLSSIVEALLDSFKNLLSCEERIVYEDLLTSFPNYSFPLIDVFYKDKHNGVDVLERVSSLEDLYEKAVNRYKALTLQLQDRVTLLLLSVYNAAQALSVLDNGFEQGLKPIKARGCNNETIRGFENFINNMLGGLYFSNYLPSIVGESLITKLSDKLASFTSDGCYKSMLRDKLVRLGFLEIASKVQPLKE